MVTTSPSLLARSQIGVFRFVVTAALIGTLSAGTAMAQPTGGNLPPLAIVHPTNGATVIGPVIVVIQTPADLSKMAMGSRAVSRAHIHIDLDKRVTMLTIKQLTKVGADRYQVNLGRAKPGKHTIRLYWADNKHRLLGSAQAVLFTVK